MTSDLEKEAGAAANDGRETQPDSSDIGNTETHVDDAYEAGYLAAAEPREKEIASLRAKLEAGPVTAMRELDEWELGLEYPCEAAAIISEWLAGLK